MNESVSDIDSKIKDLETQKKIIQDNCTHKDTTIKYCGDRREIKVVCVECKKEIRYPSQEEKEKFLNS